MTPDTEKPPKSKLSVEFCISRLEEVVSPRYTWVQLLQAY
jgi:hypothetical protein